MTMPYDTTSGTGVPQQSSFPAVVRPGSSAVPPTTVPGATPPSVTPPPVTPATPAGNPPSAHGPAPIRFGLCGAPSGGKTTFLAALSIAVDMADQPLGRWRITATDDASLTFLTERKQDLVVGHRFPAITNSVTQYHWQINGELPSTPRRLRRPAPGAKVRFDIDVEDRPGGDFLLNGAAISEEGLKRLAVADALVLLFDPTRDIGRTEGAESNWMFFHKLFETLKLRLRQTGRLDDGILPHHVAVCITKFDDPAVFKPALHHRLVDIGEDGVPRVPDDRAEDYFGWICREIDRYSIDSSTLQFPSMLRSTFHDDRVRYYATSSVGFWIGPSGRFEAGDFQNTQLVNGEPRLRGAVRPVNILEPLIALERTIRRESR
ncbi:hypothetical protein [Actinoplanes derwentensis]|uniref:Uncharacterized protein n=1 Tax=Actinoplanes derwentensis TaxID=113562 RepID=A0A1H2AW54_9ACTN|nr:hypothetical protein [Actinoplanes derwentensis]GID87280.1 hypothetical protein Ade03nite_62040 [Actinoplanes derwentensis]SDT50265.1 hypothetical protein SAMN04489716_4147 [Actinoplanes derwentensis]